MLQHFGECLSGTFSGARSRVTERHYVTDPGGISRDTDGRSGRCLYSAILTTDSVSVFEKARTTSCALHDAHAALEDDEDLEPSCIFIEPPDPVMHTDEDSADEDQSGLINNLFGRQLSAQCKVVLKSKKKTSKNSKGTKCGSKVPNEPLDVSSASCGSVPVRGCGRARGRGRGGRSGSRGIQNNAVSEELSQTTSSDDSKDDDESLPKN
ncbi:unnamed protein product [Parnassius apollo]|uniref:(apollo) hypothetical protein n=1 Tax=Parnassius apollo TaxID=110799 RepID=A0A8S3Y7K4_PARAO|nr:unnamed protein product [Parnassius apollo]